MTSLSGLLAAALQRSQTELLGPEVEGEEDGGEADQASPFLEVAGGGGEESGGRPRLPNLGENFLEVCFRRAGPGGFCSFK